LFITASYNPGENGKNTEEPEPAVTAKDFAPIDWDLYKDLPISKSATDDYQITKEEKECLTAWNEWITYWRKNNLGKFPSFPLWTHYWADNRPSDYSHMPKWKQKFVDQNVAFFIQHKEFAAKWLEDSKIRTAYTRSKAKFEWKAGDADSIWEGIIQFRPSGVRVKSATYTPTLVALNQTPILGRYSRRITVQEAALLQGFPAGWNERVNQSRASSYKQLGNAVHTGVIAYVLRKHCERDAEVLRKTTGGRALLEAVENSPAKPQIRFSL
jgi:DNA (cytosine-5)-methyltransferase 1